MNIWPVAAFVFAVLEALAVWKNWNKLEFVAKPTVMFCLFLWLYVSTGLRGLALWFGLGLGFSLVGDVFLMIPLDRMFLPGLVAFLFTHISYLIGFKREFITVTVWSLILMVILAMIALSVVRRIVSAMRAIGQDGLVTPVIVYAVVISVMLYAAMTTLASPAWKPGAALFVSVGALLFYVSDLILAWNKFVVPIRNGRLFNMMAYHLGQIVLIAGIISQFV